MKGLAGHLIRCAVAAASLLAMPALLSAHAQQAQEVQASALPAGLRVAGGRIVGDELEVGGRVYEVRWYLPDPAGTAPPALAVVEHGFARRCDNLRSTTAGLMAAGLMALCVDAPMAGGNPALADALAEKLLAGLVAPDGRYAPRRTLVGGHSAGAAFAVRLGWAMAQSAPERVAGAVLFDPVAAEGFDEQLLALVDGGRRPVRVVSANAAPCNADHNAYPALRAARAAALAAGGDGFVGLQLTDRSTHVDAEGGDTELLAIAACGQGRPLPANVQTLRKLASAWALDLSTGARDERAYPGGVWVDALVARDRAEPIE
ncbi:MAG: alpha/beta hydrolase [Burkholderiales bacterium]|nr:alpha/beta hydrolase [Burkholderiales bacterium]